MMPNKSDNFARLVAVADQKRKEREEAARLAADLEKLKSPEPQVEIPSVPRDAGAQPRIPRDVPRESGNLSLGTSVPSVPRESRSERSRERRNQVQINASIPSEVAEQLRTYVWTSHRSIADVVEQAVTEFLDRNWKIPSVPRDDQMMIDEVRDSVIDNIISHQYTEILKKPFTEADRRAVFKKLLPMISAEKISQDLVRAAIYATLFRTSQKINSFAYFIPEMIKSADMAPGALRDYAIHCENRCRREGKIK